MRDLADKVCTLTKSSSDVVLVPYDGAYSPGLRT